MNNVQNFLTSVNISYALLMIAVLLFVAIITLTDKKARR